MPIPPNRIKELRTASKLTQEELGKLIDQDKTSVNKHENHLRAISPEIAKRYAKVFKVETMELFYNFDDIMNAEAELGFHDYAG